MEGLQSSGIMYINQDLGYGFGIYFQRNGALDGVQLLRVFEAVGTCQTDTSRSVERGHQQATCIPRNGLSPKIVLREWGAAAS